MIEAAAAALKHFTVHAAEREPGGGLLVTFAGHFDAEAAGLVMDPLVALVNAWDGAPSVTVDMAKLDYISSMGIGVLTKMAVAARKHGTELVLLDPRASVLNVLELLGIPEYIPVRRSGS